MEEVQRGIREANTAGAETKAEVGQAVASTTQNTVYSAFIARLVERQDERKRSLEARGITVVTTSGALATLLLGFAAFTHTGQEFVLPASTHSPIRVALVLFTIAAISAVLTNLPLPYGEPSASACEILLDSWADAAEDSEIAVASAHTKVLRAAKRMNRAKASLLFLAIACEVGAVAAIADAAARAL